MILLEYHVAMLEVEVEVEKTSILNADDVDVIDEVIDEFVHQLIEQMLRHIEVDDDELIKIHLEQVDELDVNE